MTDDTRSRIIHAAGTVFAERGFDKATIREICRLADANLASVNYHFGDKERLFIETIKHVHRSKMKRMPFPDWPPGTPAEVKLRDFIRTTVMQMLASEELPWEARLMTREMLQPSGAGRELIANFIRPRFDLLMSILNELVPESLPVPYRHRLAFSVIGQCTFYRFHGEVLRLLIPQQELSEHFTPAQLADHIADVILSALGRQDALYRDSASDDLVAGSEAPVVR